MVCILLVTSVPHTNTSGRYRLFPALQRWREAHHLYSRSARYSGLRFRSKQKASIRPRGFRGRRRFWC
jgi:hypothetical protein